MLEVQKERTSPIWSLVGLAGTLIFAPVGGSASDQSCVAGALDAARKVRGGFERQHGVRVDPTSFDEIAQEIASETCSQVSDAGSGSARVRAASSDATRRYLENALGLGQSTATQALVADALGSRKGWEEWIGGASRCSR
jgi:hypothetical protein